jgi:hypothetical protein|tara:strand:+ start:385 stop:558 length:174 start_codon:yes stop_codon:yes gene_type:complete
MENESLVIWVLEYFDTVAGDSSIDLYKTEKMARDDAKKLSADGIIESYIVYQRRVWE